MPPDSGFRCLHRTGVCATVLGFGLLLPARVDGAPEAAQPTAVLSCEQRPSKGRVLCEVEVEVRHGHLAWADVIVVGAPDFATPLRSRIGFLEAAVRSDRRLRLPLAVLATREGEGRMLVRARSVVCEGDGEEELCLPRTAQAETLLQVGPMAPR